MNKTSRLIAAAVFAAVVTGTAGVLIANSTGVSSSPVTASPSEAVQAQAKSDVVDMSDWRETAVPKRGSSQSKP